MSGAGVSLAALRIAYTSPSRIEIELGDRKAALQGEAFQPGFGDLDLLICRDQPQAWLHGAQVEPIPAPARVALQNAVLDLLCARGWRVAIDR
ncbi:MAG: hypothetical protein ACOVKS_13355 [Aquimonas sp.]